MSRPGHPPEFMNILTGFLIFFAFFRSLSLASSLRNLLCEQNQLKLEMSNISTLLNSRRVARGQSALKLSDLRKQIHRQAEIIKNLEYELEKSMAYWYKNLIAAESQIKIFDNTIETLNESIKEEQDSFSLALFEKARDEQLKEKQKYEFKYLKLLRDREYCLSISSARNLQAVAYLQELERHLNIYKSEESTILRSISTLRGQLDMAQQNLDSIAGLISFLQDPDRPEIVLPESRFRGKPSSILNVDQEESSGNVDYAMDVICSALAKHDYQSIVDFVKAGGIVAENVVEDIFYKVPVDFLKQFLTIKQFLSILKNYEDDSEKCLIAESTSIWGSIDFEIIHILLEAGFSVPEFMKGGIPLIHALTLPINCIDGDNHFRFEAIRSLIYRNSNDCLGLDFDLVWYDSTPLENIIIHFPLETKCFEVLLPHCDASSQLAALKLAGYKHAKEILSILRHQGHPDVKQHFQ